MRRTLVAAVAVLVATGCASEPPVIDSTGVVTPTEQPTTAAPTPTVTEGPLTRAEVEELAQRMTAAMERVRTGHGTVTTGPITIDADFEYVGAAPTASSSMRGTMGGFGPYTFSILVFEGRTYLGLDGVTPPGRYFRAEGADTVSSDASQQLMKLDPNLLPATLREAAAKLRVVGAEELYGEPVVHYRSQTSLAAVVDLMAGEDVHASDVVSYDVWLDPDALVRKVELRVGKVYLEAEYSDWGKRVRIRPPAPKDVVPPPF